MPIVGREILVQSLVSLLQYRDAVDERTVLHAAAFLAVSNPLVSMGSPPFLAGIRGVLGRMRRSGIVEYARPGELRATDKGWKIFKRERPAKISPRKFAVLPNLPERVAASLRVADYRTVRLVDLTLLTYGDGGMWPLSREDVDRAVASVRAVLGNNVEQLPYGRIQERMVAEVSCPLLLTPSSFREPVLRVMATKSNGQSMPLPKRDIISEALALLGISGGIPEDEKKARQVSSRVLRGLSVGSRQLVAPASPHLWIMTKHGEAVVAPILAALAPVVLRHRGDANITAKWIREHDGKGLRLEVAKKIARKCPISSRIDSIDDHVQEFFTRLVRRDALRGRLESGLPIPYSLVASWGVRSAFVDFRNDGTEPICREMHGARTEKEVRTLRSAGESTSLAPRKKAASSLANLPDPVTTSNVEETIWFNQFWARFEGIIRARFGREADLYIRVLRAKLDEDSVSAIAARIGVNERRVRAILKDVGELRSLALSD